MKKKIAIGGSVILSLIQLLIVMFHAVGLLGGSGVEILLLWGLLQVLVLLALNYAQRPEHRGRYVRKK